MDASGNGFVRVRPVGWHSSSVTTNRLSPQAPRAVHRRRTGPGIPYYQDATPQFMAALAEFESSGNAGALARVVAEARAKDGLSLWHLLTRVTGQQRRDVFDRFTRLIALPPQVNTERVLAGDPHMLDLCWNALGLDDADWWREWKRDWKP